MVILKTANLLLRFLLELCAIVALGYIGFRIGNGTLMKYLLGIVMPLVVIVVWAIFGAPGSSMQLTAPYRLMLEMGIYSSAVIGLFIFGHTTLAGAFAITIFVNLVLMLIWGQ